MRHSQFWTLMDAVFGEAYAPTLARELVITRLGSRTAAVALAEGEAPRDVLHALCDEMDVPLDKRDGGDRTRTVPPRR